MIINKAQNVKYIYIYIYTYSLKYFKDWNVTSQPFDGLSPKTANLLVFIPEFQGYKAITIPSSNHQNK